jgi:hypothetical protein
MSEGNTSKIKLSRLGHVLMRVREVFFQGIFCCIIEYHTLGRLQRGLFGFWFWRLGSPRTRCQYLLSITSGKVLPAGASTADSTTR